MSVAPALKRSAMDHLHHAEVSLEAVLKATRRSPCDVAVSYLRGTALGAVNPPRKNKNKKIKMEVDVCAAIARECFVNLQIIVAAK